MHINTLKSFLSKLRNSATALHAVSLNDNLINILWDPENHLELFQKATPEQSPPSRVRTQYGLAQGLHPQDKKVDLCGSSPSDI